ncbi:MAG: TolC family protein, partial [Blastocatellia bacterium]
MGLRSRLVGTGFAVVAVCGIGAAQTGNTLTLKQAQALAIKNHPQIGAANFSAMAASQLVREQKSVYLPTAVGAMTGAEAETGTRIAAGGFNNPSILARYADGVLVSQFITDFGRTGKLVQSSELGAEAATRNINATRADVLVGVDEAYFGALRAQAVLKVAQETVAQRQDVLDQVTAMEKAGLKSGLDVSFARVNLAQAKLLLLQSENDVNAQFARLSTALGNHDLRKFDLVDEPAPTPLPSTVESLIGQAELDRPDLQSLKLYRDSAYQFAEAEKDLWRPTISSVGAAGVVPFHVTGLQDTYAAAAFNVTIPIFNGHLFSARRAEAEYKAQAQDQRVKALENDVSRDVRVAFLNASTAYQNLGVTQQLLDESTQAMDLA